MPMKSWSRRAFVRLAGAGVGIAGGCLMFRPSLLGEETTTDWDPEAPFLKLGKPLRVQPLFMYRLPERREEASWKSWGGVQTEAEVSAEVQQITKELEALARNAEFPLQIQPVVQLTTPQQVQTLDQSRFDVVLTYACTGGGDLLRACLSRGEDNLIFVRHRSGPVYYWYEALSVAYLQTGNETSTPPRPAAAKLAHVDDVVVDDYQELLWRLRALAAKRNLLGTRIVALGGAWGKYSAEAPQVARDRYKLEIVDVSYDDFGQRIRSAVADPRRLAAAERLTARYLTLPQTTLRTEQAFVVRAFVLRDLFRELMAEHQATAFTIKSCMGTIIPMSQTTACLTLGLLNDEGFMAFCESDFVIIPAGILMRLVSGRPVFLHNSTFPHDQMVTCAHCTSPRRLDAKAYLPTTVLTHYESEYGAAPKVEIPPGQEVTFVDPEYSAGRWLGFKGTVKANPFYAICRSQQDVLIQGDWRRLINEVRDSHWVMVCGDFLKEAGYAARKLGLNWQDITRL